MRILVLSAYHARSHRLWVEQLVEGLPEIEWQVLDLPARHFNWRIRSNPLHWYLAGTPARVATPDLVLATSMTDLATFKGLFHRELGRAPSIVYFHENQFAYPLAPGAPDTVEPRMVNLYSALAADRVVFNSRHNRDTFLEGARRFLARMPDRLPVDGLRGIADKAQVIPVPVREIFYERRRAAAPDTLRLIWNHRWEHDKGPDRLLAAVDYLAARCDRFRLHLAGERFRESPEPLKTLRDRFGSLVVDHGFLEDSDYVELLAGGGLALSTAVHDFQGLSMLEAAAAGCVPVAPDRVAYPEWLDRRYLYGSREDPTEDGQALGRRLLELMKTAKLPPPPDLSAFRLEALAGRYRALFRSLA